MKFNKEILEAIATPLTKEEQAKMDYRKKNALWLRKSAKIALQIRKILRLKNMSQTELANRLEVSTAQVSKILSGKINFEIKTIARIESVLGETIIEIGSSKQLSTYTLPIETNFLCGYVMGATLHTKQSYKAETHFSPNQTLG